MSEPKRQSLKAYLKLQECHKQIHKLLRSLEEDCTQSEVLRRVEMAHDCLADARNILEGSRPVYPLLKEVS